MKLNKTQQKFLSENGWGIITSNTNKNSNCAWIGFSKEDGQIFDEVCGVFGLQTDSDYIELLVIGAKQIKQDEKQDEIESTTDK